MQLLSKVFSVKMVYRQLITIILSIYKNFSLGRLCKALHNRLEQIADMEHVSIQSVSRLIHAAKKKILKFLSKQGEKVPF